MNITKTHKYHKSFHYLWADVTICTFARCQFWFDIRSLSFNFNYTGQYIFIFAFCSFGFVFFFYLVWGKTSGCRSFVIHGALCFSNEFECQGFGPYRGKPKWKHAKCARNLQYISWIRNVLSLSFFVIFFNLMGSILSIFSFSSMSSVPRVAICLLKLFECFESNQTREMRHFWQIASTVISIMVAFHGSMDIQRSSSNNLCLHTPFEKYMQLINQIPK